MSDYGDRVWQWHMITVRVHLGDERYKAGACYICGNPDDHDGESHAGATGDGRDRLAYVTDGAL